MGQRPTIFDQHNMSDTIKFNLNSKRQSTSTSLVSSQPGDKGGTTFIWLEKEKKMYTYNKDNSLYEPTTIGPSLPFGTKSLRCVHPAPQMVVLSIIARFLFEMIQRFVTTVGCIRDQHCMVVLQSRAIEKRMAISLVFLLGVLGK